jgi:transposase InsO family protein
MPSITPQQQKILGSILVGLGVGSLFISISSSYDARSTYAPKVAERAIVQPVASIGSSKSTADRVNLSTTTREQIRADRSVPFQSAHVTLKEARVAVALSQAHVAQARINLIEFQAKHDNSKILSQQGKFSSQQLDTAKAAYALAQSQHRSALIGLQECTAQLVAAKAEVSRLGRKANTSAQM